MFDSISELIKRCSGNINKNRYVALGDEMPPASPAPISSTTLSSSAISSARISLPAIFPTIGYYQSSADEGVFGGKKNSFVNDIQSSYAQPSMEVEAYEKMIQHLQEMQEKGTHHSEQAVNEAFATLRSQKKRWQGKIDQKEMPKEISF